MWCASCIKMVGDETDHTECAWYMCEEYTKARLAFMNQQDPGVHKGETVVVRE